MTPQPYYLFIQTRNHLLKLYLGDTSEHTLRLPGYVLPEAARALMPMFEFDTLTHVNIHDQWLQGVDMFLKDQEVDPIRATRIMDFLHRNEQGTAYMGLG